MLDRPTDRPTDRPSDRPTNQPTDRPIDRSTDSNDAIERKERCSLRSVLISLMDRVRTNATLFAEHSARIKKTLRRALDTRVVSRSTMTPISPISSRRRFSHLSTYSSSALLLVVIFFILRMLFFLMYFFNVLASLRFLSPCRYVCAFLGDVYPVSLSYPSTLF